MIALDTILLEDLQQAAGGQLFGEAHTKRFAAFCRDPQHARVGQIYLALPGADGDSQRGIEAAVRAGISGILCEEPPRADVAGVTVLLVGDVVEALGQWASYVLRKLDVTVVAVAGPPDAGLTARAVTTVLGSRLYVHCDPDLNLGRVELPISLQGLDEAHQVVVLDFSQVPTEDLDELLAIAPPDVLIMTGAASAHRALYDALPDDGVLVLNLDENTPDPDALTFSYTLPEADLYAENAYFEINGAQLDLAWHSERLNGIWVQLPGYAGIRASLAAISTGLTFGFALAEAADALSRLGVPPGRLRPFRGLNDTLLLDLTFDATPYNVIEAVDWLTSLDLGSRRLAVVLDDLTGDEGDLYALGQKLSSVSLVITRGEQARQAGLIALQNGLQSLHVAFRREDVVTLVRRLLTPGDVVLVAAERAARAERLSAALLADPVDRDWLVFRQENRRAPRIVGHTLRTWVEVDLDAIASNVHTVLATLDSRTRLAAVVAGNAYGHGAIEVGATACANGAHMLIVGTLDEALALREGGLSGPILVKGFIPFGRLLEAVEARIQLTLFSTEGARALASALHATSLTAGVHLLVDTGQGGLGLAHKAVMPLIREIVRDDQIDLMGIYTHYAAAAQPTESAYTTAQRAAFSSLLNSLRATRVDVPYIHAASSAGIIERPQDGTYNLVRAGLLIYGISPSPMVQAPTSLRQAFSWKTTVADLSLVGQDSLIGYHVTKRAGAPRRIATIPVGYADGLRREWGQVLLGGRAMNILGGLGMHSAMVAADDQVNVGDEVVLLGTQGEQRLTIETVALRLGVSPHQIVACIPTNTPRETAS